MPLFLSLHIDSGIDISFPTACIHNSYSFNFQKFHSLFFYIYIYIYISIHILTLTRYSSHILSFQMAKRIPFLGLLALSFVAAMASEHSPLQDFCVADSNSPVLVNGMACKNPSTVEANDFFFSGLHAAGNTSNAVGSGVTPVAVAQIPGLNTLGISIVRIDYAPGGVNPPHAHPRATEILVVLQGKLEAGFVTSNPENRLISKVLREGDVFVFPVGLVHFQRNAGKGNSVAVAALSSQNPGVVSVANAVFGSKPDISSDILAKAFQVEKSVITEIQEKF